MGPLLIGLYVLVLATFVGFEIITKIPPTLHTPLMSGANAISGITILGALVAAQNEQSDVSTILGMTGGDLRDHQRGRRLPGHRSHAEDVRPQEEALRP